MHRAKTEREIEIYMITRNTISFSLFPVGFSAIRTKTHTLSDYCYCTKNHLPETDDLHTYTNTHDIYIYIYVLAPLELN